MNRHRLVAALVCMVVVSSCGEVRLADQAEGPQEEPAPTVHVEPCSLVERDEMAAVIGVPLDSERLQIWDDDYYCEWFSGGEAAAVTNRYTAWAEFEVSRHRSSRGELDDAGGEGVRVIPELGAYAELVSSETYAELEVLTPAGAVVYLRWILDVGATAPELVARAVELARGVVPRVDAALPGDPASLPAESAPVIHPCRAIASDVQLRVLGFTGGQVPRDYIGGPFGGHWYCERMMKAADAGLDILGIAVMKQRPPAAAVPKVGEPVPELGAGATFAPALRSNGEVDEPAALVFLEPGGNLIALHYEHPDRDDAWHRRALVELARAVGR